MGSEKDSMPVDRGNGAQKKALFILSYYKRQPGPGTVFKWLVHTHSHAQTNPVIIHSK